MLNISVVLGEASGDICNKVSKMRDDLNLTPYESLGELFRESEYTQYAINRVVVSSKVLEYGDVDDNIIRLRNLIRSQSEFSSVVFLCKEETDADLESILIKEFTESECAVLSILSSSVNAIIEFLSLDVGTLQDKYGYRVPADDSSVVLDDSLEYAEEVTEGDLPVEDYIEQTKKKPSFLDALFGKSKKQETEAETIEDDITAGVASVSAPSSSDDSVLEEDILEEDEEHQFETSDDEEQSVGFENEDSEEISEDFDEDSSSEGADDVETENSEDFVSSTPSRRSVLDEVKVQPEVVQVEDEDLGILSAGDETAYREPSVKIVEVEKIVERVVPAQGSARSVFDSSHKRMVLVTGDRRSGVTTLAYNLAQVFSKYMSVLYVDCDVVRHGVLSMIDYGEFKKNDPVTKEAMRLCKSWESVQDGVFRVRKNLDMLTSDYGVDITKEDIEGILDIIADYYTQYDFVVLDVPLEYLDCATSVLSFAKPLVVSEGNFSGLVNLVSEGEVGVCKNISARYMNLLCKKGVMVLTKVEQGIDVRGLKRRVENILDLDYDWLGMRCAVQPVLDEQTLAYMLEV